MLALPSKNLVILQYLATINTDQNAVADLVSLGPYLSTVQVWLLSDKN